MDLGQYVTFKSNVVGGTPQYSYQWCLNSVAVSGATGPSWTFTPGSTGSDSVYLNVTDSVGFRLKSTIVPVTVNAAPSVSVSPSTVTWVTSQPFTFTASVTGGTSPFYYLWGVGGTLTYALEHLTGPISNTWTITFNSTGSYVVVCVVEDSSIGSPAEGPYSSASVTIIIGVTLRVSANMTVPGLTFTVNGVKYTGSIVTAFPTGTNVTITVSPTEVCVARNPLYEVWDVFVGWSGASTQTSATITITLSQNTSLTAGYTIIFTGKVHPV
jgi:uncharacterized repeat protein (TIGR02543 family)